MSVQRQRGPTSLNGVAYAMTLLTLIAIVAVVLGALAVHQWQAVAATPGVLRILLALVLTAGSVVLGIPVAFLIWMVGGVAVNLVKGKPSAAAPRTTTAPSSDG